MRGVSSLRCACVGGGGGKEAYLYSCTPGEQHLYVMPLYNVIAVATLLTALTPGRKPRRTHMTNHVTAKTLNTKRMKQLSEYDD